MPLRFTTACLFLLLSQSLTATAFAADIVWVLQGGVRMQQQINPFLLEEGTPQQDQSMTGIGLSLGALAGLQLSERVGLALQIDVGDIVLSTLRRKSASQFALFANDFLLNRPGSTAGSSWLLEEGMFLREFYATFWLHKKGWHRLYVGQRHVSLASSALFDGFALGVFIEADLRKRTWRKRKPLMIKFSVLLPDSSWTRQGKLSPTAHFSLIYDQRWLTVDVNAAYMYDGEGTTARMFWPALQRNVPSFQNAGIAPSCQLRSTRCGQMPASSGHHFWAGATIKAGSNSGVGGLQLFATALAYGGSFQVKLPELPDQLAGFGVFLDAGVRLSFRNFTAAVKLVYSMGAEEGTGPNGYLHGFRAIAPQLRHQHILFPGGTNGSGAKRTLGVAQLSNGFWGVQAGLNYQQPNADFKLLLSGYGTDFNTSAIAPAPSDGEPAARTMDFELNARASVDVGSWLKLFGQFDIYLPGGYLLDRSRPPIVHLWMGLEFSIRSWNWLADEAVEIMTIVVKDDFPRWRHHRAGKT